MPELLKQRVETCYQQAEAFFKRTFPRPQVSFKLRGQKAGVAHLHENLLRFNLQLYRENRKTSCVRPLPTKWHTWWRTSCSATRSRPMARNGN